MAILASLFALAGRFLGRIVSTALNWASTLLFGQVPSNRRLLLGAVTLGSLVWLITVLGILLPRVGTLLLTAVPAPGWVSSDWIRWAMLAAAVLLPIAIGVGGRFLVEPGRRPRGASAIDGILRGYPLAFVLSVVLVFVSVVAILRRGRSLAHRWTDAHIPIVVMSGGYEQVVRDLEEALEESGLAVGRHTASAFLELPTRLVGVVAGPGMRSLLPERVLVLARDGLEVIVYPSDVAISGTKESVARARAATASRLTFTRAYLTADPKTQAIEDLLAQVAGGRDPATGGPRTLTAHDRTILDEVDERLAGLDVPYDEWEVVYRVRLQVERNLLRDDVASPAPARAPGRARESAAADGRGDGRHPVRATLSWLAALGGLALVAADALLTLLESRLGRRP